jgi:hypothetical protein
MNRMKKFVAFVSSLSLAIFLLMLPFAWFLRDGLGPDAHYSSGLKDVVKTFSEPCVSMVGIIFLISKLILLLVNGDRTGCHRNTKQSSLKNIGREEEVSR